MAVRSLNKAMIIGNMTRDPELKYTGSGTPLATFGVATNREYSPSGTDEVKEDVEFHNVIAWAGLAKVCDQLLSKGDKVFIEGRLNTQTWDDSETGKKMYRTEIVTDEMILLSSSRGSGSYSSSGSSGSSTDSDQGDQTDGAQESEVIGGGNSTDEEDGKDIPF